MVKESWNQAALLLCKETHLILRPHRVGQARDISANVPKGRESSDERETLTNHYVSKSGQRLLALPCKNHNMRLDGLRRHQTVNVRTAGNGATEIVLSVPDCLVKSGVRLLSIYYSSHQSALQIVHAKVNASFNRN